MEDNQERYFCRHLAEHLPSECRSRRVSLGLQTRPCSGISGAPYPSSSQPNFFIPIFCYRRHDNSRHKRNCKYYTPHVYDRAMSCFSMSATTAVAQRTSIITLMTKASLSACPESMRSELVVSARAARRRTALGIAKKKRMIGQRRSPVIACP